LIVPSILNSNLNTNNENGFLRTLLLKNFTEIKSLKESAHMGTNESRPFHSKVLTNVTILFSRCAIVHFLYKIQETSKKDAMVYQNKESSFFLNVKIRNIRYFFWLYICRKNLLCNIKSYNKKKFLRIEPVI